MKKEQTTKTELSEELAALHWNFENLQPLSAWTERAGDEFTHFFAHSIDLLCIAGFDGYFKRLNLAWTTQLGWTLEELEARPYLDFVHPDDREATLAIIDRRDEGVNIVQFENRYCHKDGSYRWLQWDARPMPERELIFASARDVTRQKRLEREVLEIVDQEQERLGRELHDGLCQTLAGIAALSFSLSRKLALSSESAAADDAREINNALNAAIGETRGLAHGLGPLDLNRNGLEAAFETLAINIHRRFGVTCTFECDNSMGQLGHEVEAQLYRIAQEAVNNAVTHGHAKRIDISLGVKGGECRLRILDDGVGMPEAVDDHAGGGGMYTMAYRSRLVGGFLRVRHRSLHGMAVSCVFPLSATHDTGDAPA